MTDCAQLCDLTAVELAQLRANGVSVEDADIVRLNALGWAVQCPELRLELARGRPIEIGGVTLWPLTLQAADWWERIGSRTHMGAYALAYAMAHCYGDELAYSGGRFAAAARITAWSIRLRCRPSALIEAVAQVLAQDREPVDAPADKPSMAIGALSAELVAALGGDAERWERRCSMSFAIDVLHCVRKMADDSGKPLVGDPAIEALRAFGRASDAIRARQNKAEAL